MIWETGEPAKETAARPEPPKPWLVLKQFLSEAAAGVLKVCFRDSFLLQDQIIGVRPH